MLLQKAQPELLYSTIQGESIPFSIGDPSIIIDIIRKKIYSYPIRTLVQEYLSNARDACREAGKRGSDIEVHLPTHLKPEFSVRDYGVGMSDERVKEVFVRYGISTKRTSNSQLGYFGIGAKSGWAYSDSFIVESFHEKIHREYIADIAETKEGRLLLFSETPTTEKNGVLIRIPVKPNDMQSFQLAYVRTTFLWEKKPRVNTEIDYPKLLYTIGDNIKIFKDIYSLRGVYFDAGGIPFNAHHEDRRLGKWCNEHSLIAVIVGDPTKMGISANREGFSNQAYAEFKIAAATIDIEKYVINKFEAAPFTEYLSLYKEMYVVIKFLEKFLENKCYSLKRDYVYLNNGYFVTIAPRSKFTQKITSEITFPPGFEAKIYLSKSKGLWVYDTEEETLKYKNCTIFQRKNGRMPELLPETKEALMLARRINVFGVKRYVFFQENLTDVDYAEVCQVLGATEFIENMREDYLKQWKELKQIDIAPRPVVEKRQPRQPKKLVVQLFKPIRRKEWCKKHSAINIDSLTGMIFYGDCCRSDICAKAQALQNISSLKIHMVFASNSTINKLQALDNPNIKPIDQFIDFVKNHAEIQEILVEKSCYNKHRHFWNSLEAAADKKEYIVSDKFDIAKIYNKIKRLKIVQNHDYRLDGLQVEDFKIDLIEFLDRYPLLKCITCYDMPQEMVAHINLYIKAIDEGVK